MKRIPIKTEVRRMLADFYTPVGIYLRLRDRFRDTILLESTDNHAVENSYSFICIHAIAGIEITDANQMESKLPGRPPSREPISSPGGVPQMIWDFMNRFEAVSDASEARFAQGFYGYTCFDAVRFFDDIPGGDGQSGADEAQNGRAKEKNNQAIPLMRYRLYQYVIAINHFKDEIFFCENIVAGLPREASLVESLIRSRDLPVFPFTPVGDQESNMTDAEYLELVRHGMDHCHRGDVFQIVLSRRFSQSFRGDEFNVYRALRSINPSPYLYYFDYGSYKLMGSSPESQLIIQEGQAVVHPIAGTFRRTGDDDTDRREAARLLEDAKENAEHVMLVDLARNDLGRVCSDIRVASFRQVQYYSHVIHLVSEVTGRVPEGKNPFELIAKTFPAGTLSGAPKIKAIELIRRYEPDRRYWYGGAIGFIGFDASCNHAIIIRSLLSKANRLTYQAGAGIVASSVPENELKEVNNKVGALQKAIAMAGTLMA